VPGLTKVPCHFYPHHGILLVICSYTKDSSVLEVANQPLSHTIYDWRIAFLGATKIGKAQGVPLEEDVDKHLAEKLAAGNWKCHCVLPSGRRGAV
jgi:hypothetical protein